MAKINLPIRTGWKLYFREIYERIHRQVTSPWTKLLFLFFLLLLVTREELNLSISITWDDFLTVRQSSVFFNPDGADAQVGTVGQASLVSFKPAAREWTAKQRRQLAYVDKYATVALAEMAEHGIPASITLSQGLLESGTGQSTLATRNNNHFGIKCFSKKCRKGHCSNHSDDHHKDFFRVYDSPEESFADHSAILLKDRYRRLFQLDRSDYKGWARGLRSAGYATDPKYADKLIRMIEDLELWRYDKL